jgi:hypothetical protein
MYKPTVVIATHQRVELTNSLIKRLLADNENIQIVLVVSELNEFHTFRSSIEPRLHVLKFTNYPLGAKWQHGVNHARKLGANPLIILGSDDKMNKDFIPNALKYLEEGYHFIGLKRYWVEHQNNKYLVDYKPVMPIGGGRVYSAKFLDLIQWKLFEAKDRQLDDFGWKQVVKTGARAIMVRDIQKAKLEITAIKGDWKMMNPFDPNHKNLSIVCVE